MRDEKRCPVLLLLMAVLCRLNRPAQVLNDGTARWPTAPENVRSAEGVRQRLSLISITTSPERDPRAS